MPKFLASRSMPPPRKLFAQILASTLGTGGLGNGRSRGRTRNALCGHLRHIAHVNTGNTNNRQWQHVRPAAQGPDKNTC